MQDKRYQQKFLGGNLFLSKRGYFMCAILPTRTPSHLLLQRFLLQQISIFEWLLLIMNFPLFRSSPPDVFIGKSVLKIFRKFTGEQLCQNALSIKLFCNFIEIALGHRYFPVYLLHIFRTPFPKNTSGGLLLSVSRTKNIFYEIILIEL